MNSQQHTAIRQTKRRTLGNTLLCEACSSAKRWLEGRRGRKFGRKVRKEGTSVGFGVGFDDFLQRHVHTDDAGERADNDDGRRQPRELELRCDANTQQQNRDECRQARHWQQSRTGCKETGSKALVAHKFSALGPACIPRSIGRVAAARRERAGQSPSRREAGAACRASDRRWRAG